MRKMLKSTWSVRFVANHSMLKCLSIVNAFQIYWALFHLSDQIKDSEKKLNQEMISKSKKIAIFRFL